MIRALAWKEYREQSVIWVAVAVLAVLTVGGLVTLLAPQGAAAADSDTVTGLLLATVGLAVTYGLVCGSMLLAGEREAGTLAFLDTLPVRRGQVWGAKLLAGLPLVLLQGLVLAGVAVGFGLPLPSGDVRQEMLLSRWHWFWILPTVALEAYAWGLLGSAVCRNVLTAVLLSVVFLAFAWCAGIGPLAAAHGALFLAVVCVRAGLALGALAASLLLFSYLDLGRTRPVPPPPRVPAWGGLPEEEAEPIRPRPRRSPAHQAVQAVFWLAWRQGRVGILILGAAAFLAGVMLPTFGPIFWPVMTLLIGLFCGSAVYLGEQTGGSNRFLGDQRLPPGRVWGLKTLFWFGVAVAACLLVFTGALQHFAGVNVRTGRPEIGASWREVLPPMFHRNGLLVPFALWLLYGFSVGETCALAWRKSVAALFMAVVLGTAAAAVWLPSMLAGDLPAWQAFAVPAALLALNRLLQWPWVSDRLYTEGPLAALVVGALLCVAWTAICLEYRVLGVPDVGQPFDVAAFEASLPTPEQNPAGEQIRQALAQLPGQQAEATARVLPPLPPAGGMGMPPAGIAPPGIGMAAGGGAPAEFFDPDTQTQAVLRDGWPAARRPLGRWLDTVFRGDWAKTLRQGVAQPLGVIEDPRRTTPFTRLPSLDHARLAAGLFTVRALQVQAGGDDAAALEDLTVVLALSRQLRHQAVPASWRAGADVERTALIGLDRWLERLRRRPDLLRRALAELDRHERETPPAAEAVKADYLVMRDSLGSPGLMARHYGLDDNTAADRATAPLVEAAWQAPWERGRLERLLPAVYAGWLRASASDFAALVAARQQLREQDGFGDLMLRVDGTLPPDAPSVDGPTAEWWAVLESRSWLRDILPDLEALLMAEAPSRCDVRAHRLVLALTLYQAEKGKPAPDLDALVGAGYLTELPRDPFDNQPFHYRISTGEQIAWDLQAPDTARVMRLVPADTGIVWSVGPDLRDDGGKRQGLNASTPAHLGPGAGGSDLIFLVPPLARK